MQKCQKIRREEKLAKKHGGKQPDAWDFLCIEICRRGEYCNKISKSKGNAHNSCTAQSRRAWNKHTSSVRLLTDSYQTNQFPSDPLNIHMETRGGLCKTRALEECGHRHRNGAVRVTMLLQHPQRQEEIFRASDLETTCKRDRASVCIAMVRK